MSKLKLTTSKQHAEKQGVKYLLHKELAISDPPRSLDVLHASELTHTDAEFCPRERALLLKLGDNRQDHFLGTALNITFQIGRWYEDQIRDNWLRRHVIGQWHCQNCGSLSGFQTVPDHCDHCHNHGSQMKYIETRAYSKKYDTSCGLDVLVWLSGQIHVIEVKTIAKDAFKELAAPLSEHRQRTQFYLDLLENSEWVGYDVKINLKEAYILYVCKGFGAMDGYQDREGISDTKFSPFKQYIVKRGKHADMLPLYKRALAVKKFKKDKIVPARTVCQTISCGRALKCTYRKECFSNDY